MRLTLDSNILVYAVHEGDRRNVHAVALVDRASRADCIQTLQSFGETFRVLTARRSFTPAQAIETVEKLRLLFAVVAANEEDFVMATHAVRDHRLSFWDAMLRATARRAGCRLLITEDSHDGLNLGGVRFVNPFEPENGALLDVVLPVEERP
jgi:predicted nucleic acid-binding protein